MGDKPLFKRLKHAWNVFQERDPTKKDYETQVFGSSWDAYRPGTRMVSGINPKSILSAVYNRLAIDVAALDLRHVKLDDNNRFLEIVEDDLNYVLNTEANIDQTGTAFIQDVAMSLFDEGCVAIVPVETTMDPAISTSYNIKSLRVGRVTQWYPAHVRVDLYNEKTGLREELILEKKMVGIVENPLYAVMNEPNSTLQRLTSKLTLLDAIDNQSGSGKLDIIIQMPYVIKNEARAKQAEKRRKDIESQLVNSKYGIAYTDGSEKVIQLNRPAENNLMNQIEYLTSMLYSQLGLTEDVFKGTADEKTMLNYFNRTIDVVISAIANELQRKFLTKTARSQRHAIRYFRDPFKLVPVNELAEIADKFTRNKILTSNEMRGFIGMRPAKDPGADKLENSNLNQKNENEKVIPITKKVREE